jgi:hypothetical protein
MAKEITADRAREMGEEDAEAAIEIAREQPLSRRAFSANELRSIAHPSAYKDSPELPARRIATEWEAHRAGRDDHALELGVEPPNAPHVLSRFGRAKQVWKDGDDEAWFAYEGGFLDRLEEADVILVQTIYTVYPDDVGTYVDIRSLYVADGMRYETVPVPGRPDPEIHEDAKAVFEEHVQEAFVPRDEGRLRRWRRRTAR